MQQCQKHFKLPHWKIKYALVADEIKAKSFQWAEKRFIKFIDKKNYFGSLWQDKYNAFRVINLKMFSILRLLASEISGSVQKSFVIVNVDAN